MLQRLVDMTAVPQRFFTRPACRYDCSANTITITYVCAGAMVGAVLMALLGLCPILLGDDPWGLSQFGRSQHEQLHNNIDRVMFIPWEDC